MCSQFNAQLQKNDLTESIGEILGLELLEKIPSRVFPQQEALVLRIEKKQWRADLMRFSLLPKWSKESRVKFATHNARLDGVCEKPTWKEPFLKRHCLIPMTGFFEAVYEGEFAGNLIEFSTTNEILMAAGIWETWTPKDNSGDIHSFSILTDEPYPFVQERGHDRSPVFLQQKAGQKWLMTDPLTGPEWLGFLRKNRYTPEFQCRKERELKKKVKN
jgi:putative SOS response-associated peptidase YedK